MTVEEIRRLWPLAQLLHETRRDLAWGRKLGSTREPWPEWSAAYTHNPIAYVDLALVQAEAVDRHYIEPLEYRLRHGRL